MSEVIKAKIIGVTYERPPARPSMPSVPAKKAPPKPKIIWDNYKEVAEVRKTSHKKFVLAAAIKDGVKYINVREFYLRKRDSVWMPGYSGITIPLVVPIEEGKKTAIPYAEMMKAFNKVAGVLEDMELFDAENAVYYVKKEKK